MELFKQGHHWHTEMTGTVSQLNNLFSIAITKYLRQCSWIFHGLQQAEPTELMMVEEVKCNIESAATVVMLIRESSIESDPVY